jgi:predicted peptidase
MNYTLFTPANLLSGKKYPLLIWLHGGGSSSGDEIADEDAVSLSASASEVGNEKFLLIPSAPIRQAWGGPRLSGASRATRESSPAMKFIVRLVDTLPNTCNIDRRRVIVMGESGGAFGSWLLLQSFPERFLGGIINSGGGDATKVDTLVKQRIWIFHGEKDEIVPIARDQEMFAALMRSRGQQPLVVTEGDWVKASDDADMIRFWKHTQSGHVPAVDYKAAIDWVLASH